jgi:hypothetical protein
MTRAGKILVFTVLVFSLLLLTYAVVVFAGPVDVGWDPKHAHKELGQPVDSDLKKSQENVKKLDGVRKDAVPPWRQARRELADTEARIAENQLWYAYQLNRIRETGPVDPSGIQGLKTDAGGRLDLDKPRTGRPRFDKLVDSKDKPLFTKTYQNYVKELDSLFSQIEDLTKAGGDIVTLIKREQKYTEMLNGKTVGGIKEKGIYDLINREREIRQAAQDELDEVKPKYYQEVVGSQDLLERQKQLRLRVQQLKNIRVTRR